MKKKLVYKSPYVKLIKRLLSDGEWHTTHEIMDVIPCGIGFPYAMRQLREVASYDKKFTGGNQMYSASKPKVVYYKMAREKQPEKKLPCRAEITRCNGNGCYLASKCDLVCTERRAQLRSMPQQASYIVNNTANMGQALCWY